MQRWEMFCEQTGFWDSLYLMKIIDWLHPLPAAERVVGPSESGPLQNSLLHNCLLASNLQYNDPYQVNGSRDFIFADQSRMTVIQEYGPFPISRLQRL